MPSKLNKTKIVVVFLLFLVTVLSWSAVLARTGNNFLKVNFFDVGQGAAIFIEAPSGQQILVDGGPGAIILQKLGQKMSFADKNLDAVVLTHPDQDHLAGLIEVLKKYEVKMILQTCIKEEKEINQLWQEIIAQEKSIVKCVQAGDQLVLGKNVFLTILYPFKSLAEQELEDTNQSSIVARLDFGENSFLLTGDADKKIERGLVLYGFPIAADFLQVAHHGSKNSSDQAFVKKVAPRAAIIQAGKSNSYGHPHQEVLNILNLFKIKVLRTDVSGDINFLCDGRECFLASPPG